MSKNTKKVLGLSVLLILIAWLVYYFTTNLNSFKQISLEHPILLVIIFLIALVSYIPTTIVTYYLLLPLKVKLGKKEAFGLSIVTGFYNLTTPFRGGMAARAIYLKKKYNFPYSSFFSTLGASYIIGFFISAIFGLLSIYLIYQNSQVFNLPIFLIFLAIFIILGSIILFSPKIPLTKNKLANKFINVLNCWHVIKDNKKVISIICIVSLVQMFLSTISLMLQFKALGVSIPVYAAIFISAASSLALLIGITPANLGISEAIIVFSASTLGISPVHSLSAALIGRLAGFVLLFTLGPIFSYFLLKNNLRK